MTPTESELNVVLNREAALIARCGRLCAALATVPDLPDSVKLTREAEDTEIESSATRARLRELQREIAKERGTCGDK